MKTKHLIEELSSVLYSIEKEDKRQANLQLESIIKKLAKELKQ